MDTIRFFGEVLIISLVGTIIAVIGAVFTNIESILITLMTL